MSVTLEQLNNAPVGSRLTGTGFAGCVVEDNGPIDNILYIAFGDGNSTRVSFESYLATAILANPAVELILPEPEIKGWKVISDPMYKDHIMIEFKKPCWEALQAMLESMDKWEEANDLCNESLALYNAYRRAERGEK